MAKTLRQMMQSESLADDFLAVTKKTQPYAKLRSGQQPKKSVSDKPVTKATPETSKGPGGPASWYGQGRYMGDSVEYADDIVLVDINEASEGHDYAVVHYSPPGTKTIKVVKYSVKPYTTEKEVRKMHQKTFLSNVHKVIFERVELNELSPATLVHYAGAAERSPKDRKAGVRKAISKVLKSPEGKEELLRYGAKYGSRTEAKEYNAMEAPGIQDAIKRMGQRYKQEQAAKDKKKLADRDPAKLGVAKIKEETLDEGRPSQRHPLEGHEYHRKTDAELIHIAKDAHKAAEAMKSHNTDAENKYRDQANDSATVRYFRQKNGMPNWYKKKYGFVKEDLSESVVGTVREAFKDAKLRDAKKKTEKKIGSNGKDKFESDPQLSTQITKQDY